MIPHSTDQFRRIHHAIIPVLAEPAGSAMRTSEALYGEGVQVLRDDGIWCHVRQLKDGYEGFVQADFLTVDGAAMITATHRVCHRSTLLFGEADLKSQLRYRVPFGAELSLTPEAGTAFSHTACGHYVWSAHCLPLTEKHPETPLAVARSVFLGTPYLWGGRSPEGIDCSGLVQALAQSQGIAIPRDSGDQEAYLQIDVSPDDHQAQDLVYWPGHTGILVSPTELLHATAHSLNCVVEPLQAVIDRAGPTSSVKRLF